MPGRTFSIAEFGLIALPLAHLKQSTLNATRPLLHDSDLVEAEIEEIEC
jgi:hypothetical protein